MKEFILPVRVYIEDTDAGGIVYYINYLKYMERARTEFMRALGFGKQFIFESERMFVVHSSTASYLQPARLDDQLQVTVKPLRIRAASILFEQLVRRDETLLCSATIKIACVDKVELKPVPMPKEITNQLKQIL